MRSGLHLAQTAALLGEPARANMLATLMDGRARTASELAYLAGVAASTASAHLAKLTEAGLLAPARQGRHRYFRLASPAIGQMIETILTVAEATRASDARPWRGGEALRAARTCYDHLAGRLAVAISDRLVARHFVTLSEDGGEVTPEGRDHFDAIGLAVPLSRRVFCRPCLDWSERRPHIAGRLGAAIAAHALEQRWIERQRDSRALRITRSGEAGFRAAYGIDVQSLA